MYDPAAVALVLMPGALWQFGLVGLVSGSAARTSQSSLTCDPVLDPACNCRPLRIRALTLSSRPL